MNKMVCKISSMGRNFPSIRFCLPPLLLLLATSSLAMGGDRFAVAVGPRDTLAIFAPDGSRVAELAVPTISRPVKIGNTTFQVSYGRDANDLLTVILTPDPTGPQSLHFNVLSKNIDTDQQAVVTLTFSNRLDHVAVDPGYLGIVQVDSRTLRHRELADESYPAPPVSSGAPLMARTSPELAPREIPSSSSQASASSSSSTESASGPRMSPSTPAPLLRTSPVTTESVPPSSPVSATASSSSMSPEANASEEMASQGTAQGTYQPPSKVPGIPLQVPKSTKAEVTRLYWSEPITPPDGHAPPIAIDEMKLVNVQGTVTVGMPDGTTKVGENGMVVPSGSSLLTADKASAAVFIGGVNSARLLPGTDVSITQNLDGAIRHTKIDLREGTVFSRVGRRPGEKEDYTVSTPEGVAAARGTEFADHRSKDDSGHYHHYVYVVKGIVEMIVNGKTFEIIAGNGRAVGMGSIPPTQDEKTVLMALLEILQQFNVDLNAILARLNGGSGGLSTAEYNYFNQQLGQSIYLVDELNQLIVGPTGIPSPYDYLTDEELRGIIPAVRRGVDQEIQPFGTPPVTPF
jgi:hypothetical protein